MGASVPIGSPLGQNETAGLSHGHRANYIPEDSDVHNDRSESLGPYTVYSEGMRHEGNFLLSVKPRAAKAWRLASPCLSRAAYTSAHTLSAVSDSSETQVSCSTHSSRNTSRYRRNLINKIHRATIITLCPHSPT